MLFNIMPDLEPSKIFDSLNRLLREIILAALQEREVDEAGLPNGLYEALSSNPPTLGALTELRAKTALLEPAEKNAFRDALNENVAPCSFLDDRHLRLTAVPPTLFPKLKAFAIHLYTRTSKLAGVEAACGESIEDHYVRFRADIPPGNGNICCVCGTESLAQIQADVDDTEQWRGPYDHLLSKDEYPLYGVCPSNLVPICQTCNSKAKLAKDLLFKGGHRRLSFSPWNESVLPEEIQVSIETGDGLPRVAVKLSSADATRQEKLGTWDDVYKIKARVEGEFIALVEKLSEDISVSNEVDFTQALEQRALAKASKCRRTPFNFWRARVYNAVRAMDAREREALRITIKGEIPQTAAMNDLFPQLIVLAQHPVD